MHDERRDRPAPTQVSPARRPRLALVTPLPPDTSPLALQSAALLAQLARRYDVECIARQDRVDLPVTLADFPIRSTEWFAGNGAHFDRVVYAVGDHTACHTWMLDLLGQWPGAVLLQDTHIGRSLLDPSEPDGQPTAWSELYRSHGWTAVSEYRRSSDKADFVARSTPAPADHPARPRYRRSQCWRCLPLVPGDERPHRNDSSPLSTGWPTISSRSTRRSDRPRRLGHGPALRCGKPASRQGRPAS